MRALDVFFHRTLQHRGIEGVGNDAGANRTHSGIVIRSVAAHSSVAQKTWKSDLCAFVFSARPL
jgi:hypothetical protein